MLVLVVVLCAIVAAVLSPPGRAVFHRVREAVGIQHAAPALFSLPAPGRLLVVSAEHGGVWLVHDNGLKRLLGSYSDAEWSPHGRYVVATEPNELVALDLDHGVRWSLARRGASVAALGRDADVDTRIAYLTPSGLRVVAGDGTGDHLLDRHAGDGAAGLGSRAPPHGGLLRRRRDRAAARPTPAASSGAHRSRSHRPRSRGRPTAATSPSSRRNA